MRAFSTRVVALALVCHALGCGESTGKTTQNTLQRPPAPVEPARLGTKELAPIDLGPIVTTATPWVSGVQLDAHLLVISADGQESGLPAIRQTLDQLGTPWTLWIAAQRPGALTPEVLATGKHGRFHGIILATATLGAPGGLQSALTRDEWTTLADYERAFGVRRVNWYAYPTADLGFGPATAIDTTTQPLTATLTSAGRGVFPYLNAANPVPIRKVWAYLAPAATSFVVTPLLVDDEGHALAVVQKRGDGREQLTMTVDSNPAVVHGLALGYGLVNWVTRGIFLGERHVYLSAQVDDLFLASDMWDGSPAYRLTSADLLQTVAWQTAFTAQPEARAFKLDMAFNGAGAFVHMPGLLQVEASSRACQGTSLDPFCQLTLDALAETAATVRSSFKWISHTYTHQNLDTTTAPVARAELDVNGGVAKRLELAPYEAKSLVQPEVSGLRSAETMQALFDAGIRFVVSDTSKPGENNPRPNTGIPNPLQPGILEIPRRPTNLFYDVATPEQWVGAYNAAHRAHWGRDLDFSEILDRETDVLLGYLLRWEIDPWMFHQANLRAYDGQNSLLGQLLSRTLEKYRAITNVPIMSPTMDVLGERVLDRMRFDEAGASATIEPGVGITIRTTKAATVPVTGLAMPGSERYAGQNISYVKLEAGESVTVPLR